MSRWMLAGLVLVAALTLILSGCMLMHAGMDDTMGHGSGDRSHQAGSMVVKEVEKEGLKITMEVPPLSASQESTLLVKIADANTGEPKSNARIQMTAVALARHDSSHEVENSPPATFDAYEGKSKGVYEARYKFEKAGSYKVTALITLSDVLSSPAKVSVVQEIGNKKESSISKTTWMVLGGIGMVLMMGLMML